MICQLSVYLDFASSLILANERFIPNGPNGFSYKRRADLINPTCFGILSFQK